MPKYTIQVPDGRKVTAEAPDEATAMKGIQEWYAANPKGGSSDLPPEKVDPELSGAYQAADAVTGLGSGIVKGSMDLAQLPADLATLGAKGARALGMAEEDIQGIKGAVDALPMNPLALSRTLRSHRQDKEGIMGGINQYANYEPASRLGRYSKTVGEFAPGAVGGGGLANTGIRFAKYAALPGVLSERAGELTEGKPSEGLWRAAGGLAGLGLGGGLNRLGERIARSRLDDAEHFRRAGHEAYEEAKRAGVQISDNAVTNLRLGLDNHLNSIGYLPGNETRARNVLDQIYRDLDMSIPGPTAPAGGLPGALGAGPGTITARQPLTLDALDKIGSKIAQKIKDLPGDANGDRRILWAAKHYVDEFAQSLDPRRGDILAGDLPRGLRALENAKANWRIKSKLDLLDDMEEGAAWTGAARYTRGGEEHASRAEFLKFLRKNPNKRQNLTEQELNAFENVAEGNLVRNAARDFGKLSNSSQTTLFNAGAGAAAGSLFGLIPGLVVGGAIPLASRAARAYSRGSTRRAVNDARSIVINGVRLPRPYKSILGKLNTINESVRQ